MYRINTAMRCARHLPRLFLSHSCALQDRLVVCRSKPPTIILKGGELSLLSVRSGTKLHKCKVEGNLFIVIVLDIVRK
jgi:hypothetical protein